jgi:hypothetical protein
MNQPAKENLMSTDLNQNIEKRGLETLTDKDKQFLAAHLKTGKIYYLGFAFVFLSFVLSLISAQYIHALIIANFLYWGIVIVYLENRYMKIVMRFVSRKYLEECYYLKQGVFGTSFRRFILITVLVSVFLIIPVFVVTNTDYETMRNLMFPQIADMQKQLSKTSQIEHSFNVSYPEIEIQEGMKRNDVLEKLEFTEFTTEIHGYAFDLEWKGWGSIFIGYTNNVVRSVVNTNKELTGFSSVFSRDFSEENLEEIETEMNMDDVMLILGEPLRKTMIFQDNMKGKFIILTFDNNVLTDIAISNLLIETVESSN